MVGFCDAHISGDGAEVADVAEHVVGTVFSRGGKTFVVIGIIEKSAVEFFHIVDTTGCHGFVPGLLQCREQHGGKNGDDGDNDQQFNQRER